MKALAKLTLVAAIFSIPAISFAQQTTAPDNTMTQTHQRSDTKDNRDKQRDVSGYGSPAGGSMQSSSMPMRFVGKHSKTFDH